MAGGNAAGVDGAVDVDDAGDTGVGTDGVVGGGCAGVGVGPACAFGSPPPPTSPAAAAAAAATTTSTASSVARSATVYA